MSKNKKRGSGDMPTDTEKQILLEIQGIRNDGCFQGATNSAHIITLQATQKQHDKRLVDDGERIASINTKLDAMPAQVATVVREAMPRVERTMIPIKAAVFGVKLDTDVRASWVGWAAAFGVIFLGFWIHVSGIEDVKTKLLELHKRVDVSYTTNGLSVASHKVSEK